MSLFITIIGNRLNLRGDDFNKLANRLGQLAGERFILYITDARHMKLAVSKSLIFEHLKASESLLQVFNLTVPEAQTQPCTPFI